MPATASRSRISSCSGTTLSAGGRSYEAEAMGGFKQQRSANGSSNRKAGVSTPTLSIQGLSRSFGNSVVVRSLDLELGPGDRAALRGPNGSGKSTVLRCVAGTVEPSSGAVTVGGERAGTLPARALVGSALALERSFYARHSGHANLRVFAGLRGAPRQAAMREVDALVEELELDAIAPRRVEECSTGMLQQLAFARALLGEPRLVLLDEPTRSLDEGAVARLWAAVDRRPHLCLVIATHHADDVERCGTRVDLPS